MVTASWRVTFLVPTIVTWQRAEGCLTTLLPVLSASHWSTWSICMFWKLSEIMSVGNFFSSTGALVEPSGALVEPAAVGELVPAAAAGELVSVVGGAALVAPEEAALAPAATAGAALVAVFVPAPWAKTGGQARQRRVAARKSDSNITVKCNFCRRGFVDWIMGFPFVGSKGCG